MSRLDVISAQFPVLMTKRPKLASRACTGVVLQAAAPARLIEGGVPTGATVAYVLISSYANHLLSHRQAQTLARVGIEIGREILADWTGTAAMEIAPVVRRIGRCYEPRRGCSRTKPLYRSSIWAVAERTRATSRRSRTVTGHGVERIHRRWCSTKHRAAAPSMPRRC
jgi:hypothetical protein